MKWSHMITRPRPSGARQKIEPFDVDKDGSQPSIFIHAGSITGEIVSIQGCTTYNCFFARSLSHFAPGWASHFIKYKVFDSDELIGSKTAREFSNPLGNS